MEFEAVIGLEVHAQLTTESKAFSGSGNQYGALPNTKTDPTTLGMPGSLPVINEKLIEYAVMMGIATHCKIRPTSGFSRKNYFYADLAKGYQITQYADPICFEGFLEIEKDNNEIKKIGITRIHVEEDTGKSIHDLDIDTLIDFNRSGTPLIEIVSEPDMTNAQEAYSYLINLKQILVYLGICTGNMEEGALRCDANVSVKPLGQVEFGTKTEVKNLNSFRNVEKAIEYEINRQIELIKSGGKVSQETRLWDANKLETKVMRSKESAHDYRYFPEPDLPLVSISKEYLESVKSKLPELPLDKKRRFVSQYQLPIYDAGVLTGEAEVAQYYEEAVKCLSEKNEKNFKLVSNWVMTEILRLKSESNISIYQTGILPNAIADLVELIANDKISTRIAKEILPDIRNSEKLPTQIVEEKGLLQVSDSSLFDEIIKKLIDDNPESVEKYRAGRNNILGFFVGQVMQQTKGKANPQMVTEIVKKYLET